jgi:hypothetical protein
MLETLCYNPKCRGSSLQEATEILISPYPFSRIIALGSTEPLTEISTKNTPAD